MARWVGAQGQVTSAKKNAKTPHLWRHPQGTPNPKLKIFFFNRIPPEFVEGLNSSLALVVGELWPKMYRPS